MAVNSIGRHKRLVHVGPCVQGCGSTADDAKDVTQCPCNSQAVSTQAALKLAVCTKATRTSLDREQSPAPVTPSAGCSSSGGTRQDQNIEVGHPSGLGGLPSVWPVIPVSKYARRDATPFLGSDGVLLSLQILRDWFGGGASLAAERTTPISFRAEPSKCRTFEVKKGLETK